MPATFEWFNDEKTIMVERFVGDWTWEEFSDCIQGAITLIKEVEHDVIAIADYSESGGMPMSGASIRIARDVMKLAPDHWRGVVIVSDNRLIRTMVNLFQTANRTFGNKVFLESTITAAINRAETVLASLKNPS